MLHCTIHFLADVSYCDIRQMASLSKASFYRVIWHKNHAINHCATLEIKLSSDDELISIEGGFWKKSTGDDEMNGYVGALHGFLVRLKAPSPEEGGGNVSTYFSGHYCYYGINLQGICNSNCCFLYFAVAAPEKTNNAKAIKKTTLID
jgi:hypothetical protein